MEDLRGIFLKRHILIYPLVNPEGHTPLHFTHIKIRNFKLIFKGVK
jgi:hypothetical protein